jgi:hypothetical protein
MYKIGSLFYKISLLLEEVSSIGPASVAFCHTLVPPVHTHTHTRTHTHAHTHTHTHTQTRRDRETDRQTDRQIDRQIDR